MTDVPDKPVVRVERRGSSLWIWIDREERRNAINKQVISGIASAIASTHDDPSVRSIVLTGAGRKAFCAGADLRAARRASRSVSTSP